MANQPSVGTSSRSPETQETSTEQFDSIGPYVSLDPIARGGSGIVYRARHAETGEQVALKIIRVPVPYELENLRREVHTLSRIEHPGIVRVLNSGVHQGLPWYAMELIERGTLADLWAGQLSHSALLPQSLLLIQRLCAPLAFLHGEGIVHRDLKPRNIAIREGDSPVIVDFGLVSSFGGPLSREALEVGGELVGTVAYIAPEQARGEYVDARADLYSLGCILYEAVTGLPPFSGPPGEVLVGHLEVEPPVPSSLAPGLDPRLEELVLRLLAKDPRQRLGYAEDVAAILRQTTGTPPERPPVPRRSYLYRPSFAGRERQMQALSSALERVAAGVGQCVLAAGESGSGKTRLAMEVTRVANARGFRVFTGQCIAVEGSGGVDRVHGFPLHALRPLLRAVADQCVSEGATATERILGRRAKVLAAYEPTLAEVPGYVEQPEPVRLSAQAARERVLADVAETLAVMSRMEPVLLVIDDLQWADDMTLALLQRLSEGILQHAHLFILGTYRTEEVGASLEQLVRSAGTACVDLDRLGQATVRSIVSDMLAMEHPPRRLVGLLARESEGNPFFVGEYLRAAVEAEFLCRSGEGVWVLQTTDDRGDLLSNVLPLPNTLRELVIRRLGDLRDVALELVEAGAVLGRAFDPELTTQLVDVGESDLLEAVNQLLRRQVLETAALGGLRFVHDKLREVAYARIPEPRRVGLHRRAAQAIETRYSAESTFPQHYAELAHHWSLAGVNSKAIGFFSRAGRYALETGAHNDAHQLLVRALALDDERGGRSGAFQRAQWRRMLGVASFGIGDLDASIRHTTEALVGLHEHVPTTNRRWAGVIVAELLRQLMRSRSVGRLFKSSAAQGDASREILAECARACSQMATAFFYRTDTIPAVANLLRGLNRAESAGVDKVVVESSARLAYVIGTLRLHRVARTYFRRAYAASQGANDPSGRGIALYLNSEYQMGMAHWKQSQELAERSTRMLDEIGDRQEAETARAIAAHAYFFAGSFEKATRLVQTNLESAESRSHAHHVAWCHFMLGRARLVAGDFESAADLLEEAYRFLKDFPDILSVVMCEGLMATALARCGRTARALELAANLGRRLDAGAQPGVPQALDGFEWLAEAYVELCARGATEPAEMRDALRCACLHLRRFARMFPMGLPASFRASGHEHRLAGHRTKAVRSWKRSLRTAKRLDMPFEMARAHRDLARFSEAASDREYHRMRAIDLFSRLGCSADVAELAREG